MVQRSSRKNGEDIGPKVMDSLGKMTLKRPPIFPSLAGEGCGGEKRALSPPHFLSLWQEIGFQLKGRDYEPIFKKI